jgi:hypothetical protein
MAFDELHFHRRRGLRAWERIGHPLDTLTMLACMAWALLATPTPEHVAVYAGLAVLSCLFITKDEIVHARHCAPGEHWVHALLFVVHPLSLGSVALLWPALHPPVSGWASALPVIASARRIFVGQFVVTASFCVYQALYWNVRWTKRSPAAP